MELELAVRSARSNRRHHPVRETGVATTTNKAIPGYLKPSSTTGSSCHDACKYGARAHAFEDPQQNVDARSSRSAQPSPPTNPRKQHQQPPVVAADQQKRSSTSPLIRVRLVPRRLFGGRGSSRGNDEKVVKGAGGDDDGKEKKPAAENVEWKDIAAYGAVTTAAHDAKAGAEDARQQQAAHGVRSQNGSLDKKVVVNKSVGSSKMTRRSREPADDHKNNMNTDDDDTSKTTTVKPPRVKKPSVLLVAKKKAAVVVDHELVDHGYQPVSPSLLQKRASLLRDLEEEMVHESSGFETTTYSLDQEESAAAETSRRPVPAHRRVKSMSVSLSSSSRSVRFPFITRQASKNSATFKLRSKSSKAGPIIVLPPEEAKPAPARLRSRRGSVSGGDEIRSTSGRGVQLRIRSLRRRGGVGGDARTSGGFVVPAVSLRHQKTLEKKRSQRLYNNMIEETAGKLVKARKSRVKALVGAFESVISRIAK